MRLLLVGWTLQLSAPAWGGGHSTVLTYPSFSNLSAACKGDAPIHPVASQAWSPWEPESEEEVHARTNIMRRHPGHSGGLQHKTARKGNIFSWTEVSRALGVPAGSCIWGPSGLHLHGCPPPTARVPGRQEPQPGRLLPCLSRVHLSTLAGTAPSRAHSRTRRPWEPRAVPGSAPLPSLGSKHCPDGGSGGHSKRRKGQGSLHTPAVAPPPVPVTRLGSLLGTRPSARSSHPKFNGAGDAPCGWSPPWRVDA